MRRIAFFAFLSVTCFIWGQVPSTRSSVLALKTFSSINKHRSSVPVQTSINLYEVPFFNEIGGEWNIYRIPATGRISLIIGGSAPWIPGEGNSLTYNSIGVEKNQIRNYITKKAFDIVADHPEIFNISSNDILVDSASGLINDYLGVVHLLWAPHGIVVEGSRITFALNHGNLVSIGIESIPEVSDMAVPWPISLSTSASRDIAQNVIGSDSTLITAPYLVYQIEERSGASGLRLIYRSLWRNPISAGTWAVDIDAITGEVLSLFDNNVYNRIRGGVYPLTNTDPEIDITLPYADYGVDRYADKSGFFPFIMDAKTNLKGQYVSVNDYCGAVASTLTGYPSDLDLGITTGPDCGDSWNAASGTHAARSSYYHLTRINRIASNYLPSNEWLGKQLLDNVNIDSTCNAFWDGTSVNFFKSGGGCANTGEIAGVFLHEWGHGMDQNDTNGAADRGSGEAYGDITALVITHDSCIGRGFLITSPCWGYGNLCTDCTGVREADYSKYTDPTPATVANFTSINCPDSSNYAGPCGKEGHCESLVASQAFFDFAARSLPAAGYDQPTSWNIAERLWFLSRAFAGNMFSCDVSLSTGCNSGSLYNSLLIADDDDGNLNNGTPHAPEIYSALSTHQIACGGTGDPKNTSFTICPSLSASTISITSTASSFTISWTAVPGAAGYKLYRSDLDSSTAPSEIASLSSGVTSYIDGDVHNGIIYYYCAQAVGTNPSCRGPLSNYASGTPVITTGCGRPGVFEPFHPCAGTTVPADQPPVFGWYVDYESRFQVEFSASPDFSGVVVSSKTRTTKWLKEAFYLPTDAKWQKVKALGSVIYWRVKGKRLQENPHTGGNSSFVILPSSP